MMPIRESRARLVAAGALLIVSFAHHSAGPAPSQATPGDVSGRAAIEARVGGVVGHAPAGATSGDIDGVSPVGIERVGRSMAGFASAVAWHGEYVYVAASTVIQVYRARYGAQPTRVAEIEVRDWVREMEIAGDRLFVAARGDGLLAYDISDPARPRLTDRVSGMLALPGHGDVDATFYGVHAAGGRVAVARVNSVGKARGGVDALVFDFDEATDTFHLAAVITTDVRAKTVIETPLSVALTEDGAGLYIGYGLVVGELVYVRLDEPDAPPAHADFGAPFDIDTHGDVAFVALARLCAPAETCSMLSRIAPTEGGLVESPLLTLEGAPAGWSVDLSGDSLCFGTFSPARYGPDGDANLWLVEDVLAPSPRVVASGGTLDWIFGVACRPGRTDAGERDRVYVADEWGGLEIWHRDGGDLTLDLARDRVATGALSEGLWVDGTRVYAAKRGAGLWAFEPDDLDAARPVVEWIDRSDPGCACAGCCPPATGRFPYPPAVFVTAGASTKGRVAVLAADRNDAVPGDGYLMLFEETVSAPDAIGDYECVRAAPVADWSGRRLVARGDLLFATTAPHALRVYQHCPGRADDLRLIGTVTMPTTGADMSITDIALLDDLLFVSEVHDPPLADPDRGAVHVFHWPADAIPGCPARPPDFEVPPLGSFAADVIPQALAVDPSRGRLFVGAGGRDAFPARDGAVLGYDLRRFDPSDVAALDADRIDLTAPPAARTVRPNVVDLLLHDDDLFVVDRDNGLYRYDLVADAYVGFYPAHRGPESQGITAELVRAPQGVIPLYHPVSADRLPSGTLVVHEHNSGRAALLAIDDGGRPIGALCLPLVGG